MISARAAAFCLALIFLFLDARGDWDVLKINRYFAVNVELEGNLHGGWSWEELDWQYQYHMNFEKPRKSILTLESIRDSQGFYARQISSGPPIKLNSIYISIGDASGLPTIDIVLRTTFRSRPVYFHMPLEVTGDSIVTAFSSSQHYPNVVYNRLGDRTYVSTTSARFSKSGEAELPIPPDDLTGIAATIGSRLENEFREWKSFTILPDEPFFREFKNKGDLRVDPIENIKNSKPDKSGIVHLTLDPRQLAFLYPRNPIGKSDSFRDCTHPVFLFGEILWDYLLGKAIWTPKKVRDAVLAEAAQRSELRQKIENGIIQPKIYGEGGVILNDPNKSRTSQTNDDVITRLGLGREARAKCAAAIAGELAGA